MSTEAEPKPQETPPVAATLEHTEPARATAAAPGRAARFAGVLGRNWLFVLVLAAGVVLRVLALIAYRPSLLFIDSYRYLANLDALRTDGLNPIGYALFLKPLIALGGLQLVAVVQHLLGIAMAFAIYALARRFGARNWLAALATVPVLLDAYQLQIEQLIMSDLLFQVLLVALVWVAVSRGAPSPRRMVLAGLFIASAFLVRSVAITLVAPVLVYAIVIGAQWRYPGGWKMIGKRVGAMVAALAVVLGAHALYAQNFGGSHNSSTTQSANVIYGRTAQLADCTKLDLDRYQQQMCPTLPQSERPGTDVYAHRDGDPQWPLEIEPGSTRQQMMIDFGFSVFAAQPWDVTRAIAVDFAKGFSPVRETLPGDPSVERWQFQTTYPKWADSVYTNTTLQRFSGQDYVVDTDVAGFLRGYQLGGGYTPGPMQAVFLLLGILGALGLRSRGVGMRSVIFLVTGIAFTMLASAAVFEFSWRYQLPGLALLPLAGIMAITAMTGPKRRPKPIKYRPKLAAYPDQVDSSAVHEFDSRYGTPEFAPVVVVIAAYNEEGGLGPVLDDMPKEAHGMKVDILVVSDGSRDATATVAREHGAYVCVAPRNRGQGAALRLAYQLAAAHGATYIVSTDADGQYDNHELEQLLQPLLDDTADFVTGSRVLGTEHAADRMRWLGVRVFSTWASILTMTKLTDTSFGFRAMRAEVAKNVTLREPQYQSSELMLGVMASRARIVELPMTMLHRAAGETKKGNNFAYGYNYAKVMTGTWLREYVFRRIVPRRKSAAEPEVARA